MWTHAAKLKLIRGFAGAQQVFVPIVKFRGKIMSGTHGGCITFASCRLINLYAHRGTNYPSRIDFRLWSISTVKCIDRREVQWAEMCLQKKIALISWKASLSKCRILGIEPFKFY